MSTNRTPSKFTVEVLDVSSIEQEVTGKGLAAGQIPAGTWLTTSFTWGRVSLHFSDAKAETYVLCSEGVGSINPLENAPLDLDMYAHRKTDKGESFSIIPSFTATVTADEVAKLPVLRRVPLHKFIRTFGHRLDSNYNTWEAFFEGRYGALRPRHYESPKAACKVCGKLISTERNVGGRCLNTVACKKRQQASK